jgi:ankyrin repeat protein
LEYQLINWQDDRKQTPLLFALDRGYLSMAGLLLQHFNPLVHCKDGKDRNAIWHAIAHRATDLVRFLLDLQSDIWMMDFKQITPLNLAISKRSFTLTKMLLHHSTAHLSQPRLVDMDARDHPLCLAVGMGFAEIVQILIVHGANITVRNRRGQSVLHQAARKGHDDVIRQLLSYERVSINQTDSGGRTPLHCAALHGHKSTITFLLRTPGVDIDVGD